MAVSQASQFGEFAPPEGPQETHMTLPNGDVMTFPAGMSDDDINAAVKSHLGTQIATAPVPSTTGDFQSNIVRDIPIVGHLPEMGEAAVHATADWLGGDQAKTGGAGWGDLYRARLNQLQQPQEEWAAQHPVGSVAAHVLGGGLLGAPLEAPGALATEVSAVPSFGAQTLRGAKIGAGFGAASGAERALLEDPNANLTSPSGVWQTAKDIGGDTLMGSVFGAASPAVAAVATPLARVPGAVLPKWAGGGPEGIFGSGGPYAGAVNITRQRMGEDVAGGGPGVQAIRQTLEATPLGGTVTPVGGPTFVARGGGVGPLAPPPPGPPPGPGVPPPSAQAVPGTRPVTIADVAGSGVGPTGLAGTAARMQGPGQETAQGFLKARDYGAPGRMTDDINELIADLRTNPVQGAIDNLKTNGAAQVSRLYNQAIFGSPTPTGTARNVMTPELQQVIDNSSVLRSYLAKARASNPQIPNDADFGDMRLLDDAYQFLNNKVATQATGQGHLYEDIKGPFSTALKNANPDYVPAVDQARANATSLQAIEDGQNFLGRSDDETRQLLGGYSPSDQNLFRIGAADTMARKVTGRSPGADESIPLVGSGSDRRDQIRALFPSGPVGDAQAEELFRRGYAEQLMKRSMVSAIGGSQTAGRLAQDQPLERGGWGELGAGFFGAMRGEAAALPQLASGITRISQGQSRMTPEVAAEVSKNLWSADPATQDRFLRAILAAPQPVGPQLAVPLGAENRRLVPPLAYAYGAYGQPIIKHFFPGEEEHPGYDQNQPQNP